jgi:uncharacterized protein
MRIWNGDLMRTLNLVPPHEGSHGLAPLVRSAGCREIRFGGRRIFMDPSTLSAWAAEKSWERAPDSDGHEREFPARGPARLSAVCLSVTHGCNLACRYCYVRKAHPGGGDTPTVMTRNVAARAIALLEGRGPWRVGFFGGEPLLAWDSIKESVDIARERANRFGAQVRFSITTNGTLVTPQRARYLAEAGFSIIFSLDGPKELHDHERPLVDGESAGSYDLARKGLSILAEAGLGGRVTLRATFPLNQPQLRARLEYLNALCDDGLARSVSVEPAWPARHERSDMTSLESEYLDAARWAEERLAAGKRVRYHHLTKALERILLRRPAGTECGAGFGYVEVASNGEIHACHKGVGDAIGHVDTGISERARAPWRENRWYGREGCARCWARNVCGGGCRAESVEHEFNTTRPWSVACRAKRLQVRAALHVAATAAPDTLRGLLRVGEKRRTRKPQTEIPIPKAVRQKTP